jgi:OOP family OmpA-OmpF porin
MIDSPDGVSNETGTNGDRPSRGNTGLAELRSLLVGPEQQSLRALQARLDDPALQTRSVSRVLADAIALRDKDPQLTRALAPSIEEALTTSVRRDPRPLADALFPIIGPAIRKAIAHAMAGMMESFNRTLDLSLSWRALGWRFTALRTGKSFAEVALLNTLEYRVEQVFLIHRESGLPLLHATLAADAGKDADQISGMLTAIRDFVQDSFGGAPEQTLDALRVGELAVYIEQGPQAVLAAVVRGTAPPSLRATLQETIETIHRRYSTDLESFKGDASPFEKALPVLEGCLVSRFRPLRRGVAYGRWIVAGALLLGAALWAGSSLRDQRRWNGYLEDLQAQPGIVVVDAGRRAGKFFVVGLRDPLAADPRVVLAGSGIPAERVEGRWELYQALDHDLVLARARVALTPPASVGLSMREDVLVATGSAPGRWISDSARLAPMIPGLRGFDHRAVVVTDLPVLKEQIEGVFVRFQAGVARLVPGQEADLGRLNALLQQLDDAAQATGTPVTVTIVGHTDTDGTALTNRSLSEARARFVMASARAAGLQALNLSAVGVGDEVPLSRGTTEADKQQNRRVSVRVSLP